MCNGGKCDVHRVSNLDFHQLLSWLLVLQQLEKIFPNNYYISNGNCPM